MRPCEQCSASASSAQRSVPAATKSSATRCWRRARPGLPPWQQSPPGRAAPCARTTDQPFAATYPGLLTLGIDDPNTYIYRGIVADCLRGAEFLQSLPAVDARRVAITGNDLALITAGRRPGFAVVQAAGLLFYRLMQARERSEAYPVEEINDYLRSHLDQHEAVARTLAYFDPSHHVSKIRATTSLSVGRAG